jgi:hypothetical protein
MDQISTALPGLSAATNRFDTPPNKLANKDSRGGLPTAGAPIAEAAYRSPQAGPSSAATPDGVERSAAADEPAGFDSKYASLRSSTPAYLAAYDRAGETSSKAEAAEMPDPARERAEKADSEKSAAAAQTTLNDTNAVVVRRYDVGQSF